MRLALSALGPLFLLVFLACGPEASEDAASVRDAPTAASIDASERPVDAQLPGVPATSPPVAEAAPAAPRAARPQALEQPSVATGSNDAVIPPTVAPTPAVIVPGAVTESPREAIPNVSQPPSTNANDSGDLPSGAAALAEPTPTQAAFGETVAAALFTLPSARGGEVSLESYAGNKTIVLTFYRAFW